MKSKYICLGFLLASMSAFAGEEAQNLKVGTGTAKLNGLVQVWAINDTTATTVAGFNFRLRRAEARLSGTVVESTRWFLGVDFAKALKAGTISVANDNKVLQDLGVAYSLNENIEFQVGQFKAPTTWEGLDSSADLWFTERYLESRTYGDKREPGAMLSWKNGGNKLQAMVSNGSNTNTDDTTSSKDLTLRAEVNPVDPLKLAIFTTAGDFGYYTKGRVGAGMRLRYEPAEFRAEYVRATDLGVSSGSFDLAAALKLGEQWMPAIRYTYFDTSPVTSQFGICINYFIANTSAKIQLDYTYMNNIAGNNGSPAITPGVDGSQMVMEFQMAF